MWGRRRRRKPRQRARTHNRCAVMQTLLGEPQEPEARGWEGADLRRLPGVGDTGVSSKSEQLGLRDNFIGGDGQS